MYFTLIAAKTKYEDYFPSRLYYIFPIVADIWPKLSVRLDWIEKMDKMSRFKQKIAETEKDLVTGESSRLNSI